MSIDNVKQYIDNIVSDKGKFYGEVRPSFIQQFKDRCYIITDERLRSELNDLGLHDTIFTIIITNESKDLPSFIDMNRTFLYYENKKKKSDINKSIDKLVRFLFPNEVIDLKNRRGLSSLILPPTWEDVFTKNYDSILKITQNFDDTSLELYLKILTVLQNGKKSILSKFISPIFKMYNELVIPGKGNSVVSGGLFNGVEVRRILNQIGPGGKLLGFEPSKTCGQELKMLKFDNFIFRPVALGESPKSFVYFDEEFGGRSHIAPKGQYEVAVSTIDAELRGERCHLIKLNICGQEPEALKGAKNTITKYKPKLQIYLTYKNLIKIPKLLLEFNPEYHFYLGYYDIVNNLNQIILYAI